MKLQRSIFLTLITILGRYCISSGFSTIEYTKLITDNLQSNSNKTNATQAGRIMKQLCINIYKEKDQEQIYDPQQSLFVTIACNTFMDSLNTNKDTDITPYLKRKNFSDMSIFCPKGQIETNNPYCIPEKKNNAMDYNYLMLKLIQKVQNEWSNIGIIRAYGLQNISTSKKTANNINNYLGIYYNVLGKTPEEKSYPKTYQQLTKYILKSEKILGKLYFIDSKKVANAEQDIRKINENKKFKALWAGAFFDNNDTQDIITHAMYNELFFYTLFSSVYNEYLPNFRGNSNENIPQGLQDTKKNQDRIIIMQAQGLQQRTSIQQVTQQTLKEINNLQSSFPLHIGFLLYQEDLYNLRKKLSIVYLPLHQLHYKIENVQSKE